MSTSAPGADETAHTCVCRITGDTPRTLAVSSPRFRDAEEDLVVGLRAAGWTIDTALGAIAVRVGRGLRYTHVAACRELLRAALGERTADEARAIWLDVEPEALGGAVSVLIHARPFDELGEHQPSPLRRLLLERRIETWFQPVFVTSTLEPWGHECLMRAHSDDGDLISAVTLLGWARDEGLLPMLDRVCRETHIANAARTGLPATRFLINFLPTVIYQPDFCLRSTVAAARRTGLDPRRLVFEVVETERVTDSEHLARILESYRRAGFWVALDDMGSGYAGLELLAELEPDLVKLDRRIFQRAVDHPAHLEVSRALVDLGHRRGQLVLAEGIETREHLALAVELGVDLVQGFGLGRPAPEAALEATMTPIG